VNNAVVREATKGSAQLGMSKHGATCRIRLPRLQTCVLSGIKATEERFLAFSRHKPWLELRRASYDLVPASPSISFRPVRMLHSMMTCLRSEVVSRKGRVFVVLSGGDNR